MIESVEKRFNQVLPADIEFCSLRVVCENNETLSVRQSIPAPAYKSQDAGAMITVVHQGGLGYAATSDLSNSGLTEAINRAKKFAALSADKSVVDYSKIDMPTSKGEYISPVEIPWSSISRADKIDMLKQANEDLKIDDRIVDYEASLWHISSEMLYVTNTGARTYQQFSYIAPSMYATANEGSQTQIRTFGSLRGNCKQGGLEMLDRCNFKQVPHEIAEEAIELLTADNCPTGKMSLLLGSDQMMLQIHESIGHPLELDRILGDERNYAGTSFVTPDMFGTYQYGSELLNVTFDPTIEQEFASYGFDDDGLEAKREYIIKDGTLVRGLGGVTSQARSGLEGVADSRACNWNRPPIDRMANLNVEPGQSTLAEMIEKIELGVYMKTNKSWSIDDSRNKFQFGCEYGHLIENGKITKVVKNPNYRGISKNFWRSLSAVGNEQTRGIFGTPYCGKGEPNQCVRVGHASPICLFDDISVFGGE